MGNILMSLLAFLLGGVLAAQSDAKGLTEPEKKEVNRSIDRAVSDANTAVANAVKKLKKGFQKTIVGLNSETERDDEDALLAELDSFSKYRRLPNHRAMGKARKRYIRALKDAESSRDKSLEKILLSCKARDFQFWVRCRRRVSDVKSNKLVPEGSSSVEASAGKRGALAQWSVGQTVTGFRRSKLKGKSIECPIVGGKIVESSKDGFSVKVEEKDPKGMRFFVHYGFKVVDRLRDGRVRMMITKQDPYGPGGIKKREGSGTVTLKGKKLTGICKGETTLNSGGKIKYSGKFELRLGPGQAKDAQLEYWGVGAKFKGTRVSDNAKVAIEGVVLVSDKSKFVVQVRETWVQPSGTHIEVRVRCDYKRLAVDAKTGKVTLRATKQVHTKRGDRTKRSKVSGDVEIDGRMLAGKYRFSWKTPKHRRWTRMDKEYPIELQRVGK